ncbi:hypothetical protein P167DRAFT_87379 [Morchella conica CCBAS932]|uniref:Uncharacterized protein n=1 Tax=Morchella conica CCBAS932 TaxID=1392247 RepID=A0A3N4KXD5_9PEZI|nr:hypothetical protein P167DRAFT_87379 [Morchella conica CCBAS932]
MVPHSRNIENIMISTVPLAVGASVSTNPDISVVYLVRTRQNILKAVRKCCRRHGLVNVKAESQEQCFRLIKTHGVRILTGIPAAVLGLSISRALYLRELVGIVFRFIFFSGGVIGEETRVSHLDPTARVA